MPGQKIKLSNWNNRFGNNIFQLANACCYAVLNDAFFESPPHRFVKSFAINKYVKYSLTIEKDFFYGFEEYDGFRYKYIKEYISPNLTNIPTYDTIDSDTIIIHIRSGDIFGEKPHKKYIQNPLNYFQKIIDLYNKAIVVCEDFKNPIISELKKNKRVEIRTLSLKDTVATMLAAQNIVFSGVGTFGPMCAMLSCNIKKIYMTNISNIDNAWIFNPSIKIEYTNIDLNKYISPNTWENSDEQRRLMVEYNE